VLRGRFSFFFFPFFYIDSQLSFPASNYEERQTGKGILSPFLPPLGGDTPSAPYVSEKIGSKQVEKPSSYSACYHSPLPFCPTKDLPLRLLPKDFFPPDGSFLQSFLRGSVFQKPPFPPRIRKFAPPWRLSNQVNLCKGTPSSFELYIPRIFSFSFFPFLLPYTWEN